MAPPAAAPVLLGVVGDSAAGKTTITGGIAGVLGADRVTVICSDDYHRYNRRQRAALEEEQLHDQYPGHERGDEQHRIERPPACLEDQKAAQEGEEDQIHERHHHANGRTGQRERDEYERHDQCTGQPHQGRGGGHEQRCEGGNPRG